MVQECLKPCSLPEFSHGKPKVYGNQDLSLGAVILGAKAGHIDIAVSVPSYNGTSLHTDKKGHRGRTSSLVNTTR